MRTLFFSFILFLVFGFNINEESIRKSFHESMFSEKKLENFIKSKQENCSLSLAYKGISETMLAKYYILPTTKLQLFNSGKQKVEQSVKAQKENAELRYIRLLIQLNAPSMLGYNSNINDDLKIFTKYCTEQIKDKKWLKKFIINLQSAEKISDAQKNNLQQLLNKIQ